ncbi:hypothetical protein [Verrucomicrobium sp. 3C]|uniref:hypothetical protein n=1 Tax=Verrucomicrobium sp. 3C TaxID=1134055 RepID=UPI000363CA24|nr:hypothetical protein [Verrucomicrobium sp. 3C]
MRAGVPRNDLKRSFLRRFGLTARQFNAIRIELEDKIASIQEKRPERIEEAKRRIQKSRRGDRPAGGEEAGLERPASEKAAACHPTDQA